MDDLTKHQRHALSKCPLNWFDPYSFDHDFRHIRRPEFTAKTLYKKGLLERRFVVTGTYSGKFEYRTKVSVQ